MKKSTYLIVFTSGTTHSLSASSLRNAIILAMADAIKAGESTVVNYVDDEQEGRRYHACDIKVNYTATASIPPLRGAGGC